MKRGGSFFSAQLTPLPVPDPVCECSHTRVRAIATAGTVKGGGAALKKPVCVLLLGERESRIKSSSPRKATCVQARLCRRRRQPRAGYEKSDNSPAAGDEKEEDVEKSGRTARIFF